MKNTSFVHLEISWFIHLTDKYLFQWAYWFDPINPCSCLLLLSSLSSGLSQLSPLFTTSLRSAHSALLRSVGHQILPDSSLLLSDRVRHRDGGRR